MKTTKVTVNELVSYLPEEMLSRISEAVNVDYQVKYLTGNDVLFLLLYSHLNTQNISLREVESLSKNPLYHAFAHKNKDYVVPHSTLSDRLSHINAEFFEQVYISYLEQLQSLYSPEEFKNRKIIRYDSTFVGLSSQLLKIGMQTGRKSPKAKPVQNHVKFTIGFNGLFSTVVENL